MAMYLRYIKNTIMRIKKVSLTKKTRMWIWSAPCTSMGDRSCKYVAI